MFSSLLTSPIAYDFMRNPWSTHKIIIRRFEFCCLISVFFSLFKSNNRLLGFLGASPVVVKCGRCIRSFPRFVILRLFGLKVAVFEEFRGLRSWSKVLMETLNAVLGARLNLGKTAKNYNFRPFTQVLRAHLGIMTSYDLAFFWAFQLAH